MWEQHWELPADIGAGLPTSYFQLALPQAGKAHPNSD